MPSTGCTLGSPNLIKPVKAPAKDALNVGLMKAGVLKGLQRLLDNTNTKVKGSPAAREIEIDIKAVRTRRNREQCLNFINVRHLSFQTHIQFISPCERFP